MKERHIMKDHLLRVGEKNNFNQTDKEYLELKKYEKPGRLVFVNSNARTKIMDKGIPSIVTVNPNLTKFVAPKGELGSLAACRIKVCMSDRVDVQKAQKQALEWCALNEVPALVTFMRFRSKASLEKFGCMGLGYVWNSNYYRPDKRTQNQLIKQCVDAIGKALVFVCDKKGTGCPDCGNCGRLTYGRPGLPVHSLNLSISGIKDATGKRGICSFDCPDCWGKIVTYGKSPACDKVIQNNKQKGEISHV